MKDIHQHHSSTYPGHGTNIYLCNQWGTDWVDCSMLGGPCQFLLLLDASCRHQCHLKVKPILKLIRKLQLMIHCTPYII